MTESQDVFSDLASEAEEVDRLVADLDAERWRLPTPAPGWTIANQIAHLSFIFRIAGMAAADPEGFKTLAAGAAKDFNGAVNAALADYADHSYEELVARWRDERDACIKSLAAVPNGQVVPWLVNPLPPAILACAGIMELFAHGQDIADALEVRPVRTDRIRHLVEFAVLTRDFGYQARGLTPPPEEFRFEITAPSGEAWRYGPAGSPQVVSGPAVDFCLLVTRRRHRADLAVRASGDLADRWLDVAQAYRGPAGPGREPGQFAHLDR